MTSTTITSKNVKFISSGTIIQFNKKPIDFHFDLSESDIPFKITFDFKNNLENPNEQKIVSDITDDDSLRVTFINFNNALGTGNTKPTKLGVIDDLNLYLNYRIYALDSNSDKTIHYTFYLSEDTI